jgi:hypothetical protein
VRGASWAFIVCVTLSAASLFLPAVELRVGAATVGRRASRSLFELQRDRAFGQALVSRYQRSTGARVGGALIAVLAPKVHGRVGGDLGDAHDAMDALDQVSVGDAGQLATLLVIGVWGILALHAVPIALVIGDVVAGRTRRRRAAWALVVAVVLVAKMVTLALIIRWVVGEANDEIGREVIGAGLATWLGPIAAIGAVIAGAVVVVSSRRSA